jgi:hypothetical protein
MNRTELYKYLDPATRVHQRVCQRDARAIAFLVLKLSVEKTVTPAFQGRTCTFNWTSAPYGAALQKCRLQILKAWSCSSNDSRCCPSFSSASVPLSPNIHGFYVGLTASCCQRHYGTDRPRLELQANRQVDPLMQVLPSRRKALQWVYRDCCATVSQ